MIENTNTQYARYNPHTPNAAAAGLTTPLPIGGSIVGMHGPMQSTQSAGVPHDYTTQRLFRQLTGGGHSTALHGGAQQRALDAAMHASGIHGRDAVNLRHTLETMSRGQGIGAMSGMPQAPTSAPHHVSRPNIGMPRPHF